MSKSKAIATGLFAGAVAGIAMTVAMLLLAWAFNIATPLFILGDRLSVFISPKPFFWIMGRVGGYNHLKQLGVGSSMLGQILVGAIGGLIYGIVRHKHQHLGYHWTFLLFVVLPLVVSAILLWPVLGTHYGGIPIDAARLITLLGLAICFLLFERVLVLGFNFLTNRGQFKTATGVEFSPRLGRRAFLFGTLGVLIAGGGAAIARKLFQIATFSYDGTQYLGDAVQPITPNDRFYCVTKNVVDPRVDMGLWHLEVNGLVQNARAYRILDFKTMEQIDQETTLMCISNGLDAGLMSNAVWRGIRMADLLQASSPLAGAERVRLYGVDNYTDTVPFEKAMNPTTLVALMMNGVELPDRHGFPARAIVPGYFGEKHVKWLTRIEVTKANAKGFYETQGWGPNFTVPTRSRIDVPYNEMWIKVAEATKGVPVKGVAFGGDRGVSRVEFSSDDGENWDDAKIDYPGTKLSWALWSFDWKPDEVDDYTLVVRATDGDGKLQEYEEDRPFTSGITGFHKIIVRVVG
jgi:DMSO/TMAO reductase YedYZ molybdopterin-dependent catalytic subunit